MDDTPTACPLCGGATTHVGCRLCGGVGVVDAVTRQRWASASRMHATSTTVSLADLASLIVDRLHACADAEAPGLAAEGQGLLDELAAWRLEPVDGPTRAATYGRVGGWQRRALEALTRRP